MSHCSFLDVFCGLGGWVGGCVGGGREGKGGEENDILQTTASLTPRSLSSCHRIWTRMSGLKGRGSCAVTQIRSSAIANCNKMGAHQKMLLRKTTKKDKVLFQLQLNKKGVQTLRNTRKAMGNVQQALHLKHSSGPKKRNVFL